jgi:hypothetical protein
MNTISLRLYPETEALYKRLLDECDAGTNGKPATADQFINYLLECAQNPRKVEVSKAADQELIKNLQQEVETLKTELLKLSNADNSSSEADKQLIQELEHKVFRLEGELTILKEKNSTFDFPGAVIFRVTEAEQNEIEVFTQQAKQKFNVDLDPGQALFFLIRDKKLKGEAY